MPDSDILRLLQCPDCTAPIARSNSQYLCRACGREFANLESTPDLTPLTSVKQPLLLDDENLKKWYAQSDVGKEYFYTSANFLIRWVNLAGHRDIRKMRSTVSSSSNRTIVFDLGCGDGAHIPFMNSGDIYIGGDIDAPAVEILRKNNPETFAARMDAYGLPIKSDSVDHIVSVYALEHMAYMDLILEELKRILKPGGHVFISVPNEGGLAWSVGRYFTSYQKFHSEDLDYNRVIMTEHLNCIWQMERTLKRHFTMLKQIRFPLAIPSKHSNLVTTFHCRAD